MEATSFFLVAMDRPLVFHEGVEVQLIFCWMQIRPILESEAGKWLHVLKIHKRRSFTILRSGISISLSK